MWTTAFWKATTERALKTTAQTLLALAATGDDVGIDLVPSTGPAH